VTDSFKPTFTFNASDNQATILTCSLVLDNGTEEIYAGTEAVIVNVSSNIVSNVTLLDGEYSWYVNCSDGINNNVSLTWNFNLTFNDTIAPTIELILQQNNSIDYANAQKDYNFTVNDNNNRTGYDIDCIVYYRNTSESFISGNYGSINNIVIGQENSVSGTQSETMETEWYVNCTDAGGNTGQSEKRIFTYYKTAWLDNMEPGKDAYLGNWNETYSLSTETWGLQNNDAYGGEYLYADSVDSEYEAAPTEMHLTTPVIDLRRYHTANVTFYNQYNIQGDGTTCYDAMIIEVSTDGSSFTPVEPMIGSYGTISAVSNPRNTEEGFCGNSNGWVNEVINLSDYAGETTVYLRWTLATNTGTGRPGYDLDNVVFLGEQDNVNPEVKLVSPKVGYSNGSSVIVPVTFTCNATDDYHLRNISLYITNANNESFKLNRTQSLDGEIYNETSWTLDLGVGDYTWNCNAYDFADNYDWADVNRTVKINYTDLTISNIYFSAQEIVEGQNLSIYVNVTNQGTEDAGDFAVRLNISLWNGTKNYNGTLYSNYLSLLAGNNQIINFEWNISSGTYIFDASVDYLNNVTEGNETNNELSINYTVSSWHTFYGQINSTLFLSDNINNEFMNWTITNPSGNLYYYDFDSSFYPFDLIPLNGTNDLEEADIALGLTGFIDSLINLFDRDKDGYSDDSMTLEISGSNVANIPIINSTNNSNFITGILYDSNDGVGYDGSQDLVFITAVHDNQQGRYGIYDYEVRLPSPLEKLKGSFNLVSTLTELR
ncbi:MAG: hypothetical protein KAQ83_04305, partial [Nanoarchaeota archaeon]|nr:hypothetical protein [Nanoarchaeota archaeon]